MTDATNRGETPHPTGIVAVKADMLDRAYIEKWATALGVVALWKRISAGK